MRRPHAAILSLFAWAAASGCGEEFDPQSLLNTTHILALVAEPLDVGLGESTTVTPHLFEPEGAESTLTWSACPVSLGGRLGFQCIDPRCEIDIQPTFSPAEVALTCFEAIQDDIDVPDDVDPVAAAGAADEPLPVQVRLKAGDREAVTVVNLHFAATPPSRNRHPVITEIKSALARVLEGDSAPVEAVVDPAFVDRYDEEEAGQVVERTEEILVEWYSTTGRFSAERTDGPHETDWVAEKLEQGLESVDIWAVARDLRGGQAVAGPLTLGIERQ